MIQLMTYWREYLPSLKNVRWGALRLFHITWRQGTEFFIVAWGGDTSPSGGLSFILQCYTALLCCHCHDDLRMKFWLAAKIAEDRCEEQVWNMRAKYEGARQVWGKWCQRKEIRREGAGVKVWNAIMKPQHRQQDFMWWEADTSWKMLNHRFEDIKVPRQLLCEHCCVNLSPEDKLIYF